jgi:chromosome segregation ATPase
MRRSLMFVPMLLVPAALLVVYGCGPRVEVAKKKALDRLDDMLGKMDVQRQEIDDGIKATKKAVEGVRKARISAQVKLDQIDEKAKPFEEKVAQCDQTLAKLRDLLKADQPADIAGKTYSIADLKDMAGKVIQARKDAEKQIDGFKTARDNMRKVVSDITRQQQALEGRLTNLQGQVAKLDAEMAAAKSMKQASASMGDKDASLSANLDSLEEKIAGLSADVRAELQSESEKWSETKTDKAISDVDAFIRDSQRPADTVAEIDRVLGTTKK